jgi:hypothetical protein
VKDVEDLFIAAWITRPPDSVVVADHKQPPSPCASEERG